MLQSPCVLPDAAAPILPAEESNNLATMNNERWFDLLR